MISTALAAGNACNPAPEDSIHCTHNDLHSFTSKLQALHGVVAIARDNDYADGIDVLKRTSNQHLITWRYPLWCCDACAESCEIMERCLHIAYRVHCVHTQHQRHVLTHERRARASHHNRDLLPGRASCQSGISIVLHWQWWRCLNRRCTSATKVCIQTCVHTTRFQADAWRSRLGSLSDVMHQLGLPNL
jgi:hypothetical protein